MQTLAEYKASNNGAKVRLFVNKKGNHFAFCGNNTLYVAHGAVEKRDGKDKFKKPADGNDFYVSEIEGIMTLWYGKPAEALDEL